MLAVLGISGKLGRMLSVYAIPMKHFVVHLGLPPNHASSWGTVLDTNPAVLQESLGLATSSVVTVCAHGTHC